MKIGGLQRCSLIDYPGKIGAVVFTQGCNFRCPYCHNPELVDPARFGPSLTDEVIPFLEKRRGLLEAVTITGGEPTLQPDLEPFLLSIRRLGYLIKLDTNGSMPDVLSRLIGEGLVDYLAMDVKGPLDRYEEIAAAAVDTEKIARSIGLIAQSGIEHEFRTTVVRSQLTQADLAKVAGLFAKGGVYVLQPFVATKVLNGPFLNETTYSPEEFSAIRDHIGDSQLRVILR
jgi:pyruvate formate lyase activating enzyme